MSTATALDYCEAAIEAVCQVWDVERDELLGRCRFEPRAEARTALYLVARNLGVSWWNIAKATHRASHQTVIHGANRTRKAMLLNQPLTRRVQWAEALARELIEAEAKAQPCPTCGHHRRQAA